MHGRGIKPFTKRVEDCRHTQGKQTSGGGRDYVKWLESEPQRRIAKMVATDQAINGDTEKKDIQPDAV